MAFLQAAFSKMSEDGKAAFLLRVGISIMVLLGLAGIVYMFLGGKSPVNVAATQGLIAGVLLLTIVILVMIMALTALYAGAEPDIEKRIRLARDVVSPLFAIFGTVIGFYFGSQTGGTKPAETPPGVSARPAEKGATTGSATPPAAASEVGKTSPVK